MAIKHYEHKQSHKRDAVVDITASNTGEDEKILFRVINEPSSSSGYIGIDTAHKMVQKVKEEEYDKGFLVGSKFTDAAAKKLEEEGIQTVSESRVSNFQLEELYSAVRNIVDDMCKEKCGKAPQHTSDCKGYSDGHYSCEIRLISDNATFHFEKNWRNLLHRDGLKLLSLQHSESD